MRYSGFTVHCNEKCRGIKCHVSLTDLVTSQTSTDLFLLQTKTEQMKKTFLAILFLVFFIKSFSQIVPCSIYGDGTKRKDQISDSLKNRSKPDSILPEIIIIDKLIKSAGTEQELSLQEKYASVEAYIFNVKRGGQESCECHEKDKEYRDLHIEIVKDLKRPDKTKRIICESTRYSIKSNPDVSFENIKKLIGKKVRITGYLFYDAEHKQNAKNTSISQTNVWRASCWEIHPVESIQEIR